MLKKTVKFYGSWKSGKAMFDNKELFDVWAKSQKDNIRFECTWEKEGEDISKEQRGYFHGMVIPTIALATGHSEEETEGVLKKRFLTVNKDTPLEYVRSETSLTKEEYASLINESVLWVAQFGIIVPPPSKLLRE